MLGALVTLTSKLMNKKINPHKILLYKILEALKCNNKRCVLFLLSHNVIWHQFGFPLSYDL